MPGRKDPMKRFAKAAFATVKMDMAAMNTLYEKEVATGMGSQSPKQEATGTPEARLLRRTSSLRHPQGGAGGSGLLRRQQTTALIKEAEEKVNWEDLSSEERSLLQARIMLLKRPDDRTAHEVSQLTTILTRNVGVKYFQSLPTGVVENLCAKMTVHNVQGGEVLFRQGDIGHHFFIIIHGKVLVWIKPPPDAEDQDTEGELANAFNATLAARALSSLLKRAPHRALPSSPPAPSPPPARAVLQDTAASMAHDSAKRPRAAAATVPAGAAAAGLEEGDGRATPKGRVSPASKLQRASAALRASSAFHSAGKASAEADGSPRRLSRRNSLTRAFAVASEESPLAQATHRAEGVQSPTPSMRSGVLTPTRGLTRRRSSMSSTGVDAAARMRLDRRHTPSPQLTRGGSEASSDSRTTSGGVRPEVEPPPVQEPRLVRLAAKTDSVVAELTGWSQKMHAVLDSPLPGSQKAQRGLPLIDTATNAVCVLRELAHEAEALKAQFGEEAVAAGFSADARGDGGGSEPPPGYSALHMRVGDFEVLHERLGLAMALVAGLIHRHASKFRWITLLRACDARRVQQEAQEKAAGTEPSLEPVGDSRSRDVEVLLPHENYGHLVAEMNAGSAFGELAITSDAHRERTATIVVAPAEEGAEFGVVDKELYNSSLRSHDRKQMMNRVRFLQRHEAFEGWTRSRLMRLAYKLRERVVAYGTPLLRPGQAPKEVSFVRSGSIRVSVRVSEPAPRSSGAAAMPPAAHDRMLGATARAVRQKRSHQALVRKMGQEEAQGRLAGGPHARLEAEWTTRLRAEANCDQLPTVGDAAALEAARTQPQGLARQAEARERLEQVSSRRERLQEVAVLGPGEMVGALAAVSPAAARGSRLYVETASEAVLSVLSPDDFRRFVKPVASTVRALRRRAVEQVRAHQQRVSLAQSTAATLWQRAAADAAAAAVEQHTASGEDGKEGAEGVGGDGGGCDAGSSEEAAEPARSPGTTVASTTSGGPQPHTPIRVTDRRRGRGDGGRDQPTGSPLDDLLPLGDVVDLDKARRRTAQAHSRRAAASPTSAGGASGAGAGGVGGPRTEPVLSSSVSLPASTTAALLPPSIPASATRVGGAVAGEAQGLQGSLKRVREERARADTAAAGGRTGAAAVVGEVEAVRRAAEAAAHSARLPPLQQVPRIHQGPSLTSLPSAPGSGPRDAAPAAAHASPSRPVLPAVHGEGVAGAAAPAAAPTGEEGEGGEASAVVLGLTDGASSLLHRQRLHQQRLVHALADVRRKAPTVGVDELKSRVVGRAAAKRGRPGGGVRFSGGAHGPRARVALSTPPGDSAAPLMEEERADALRDALLTEQIRLQDNVERLMRGERVPGSAQYDPRVYSAGAEVEKALKERWAQDDRAMNWGAVALRSPGFQRMGRTERGGRALNADASPPAAKPELSLEGSAHPGAPRSSATTGGKLPDTSPLQDGGQAERGGEEGEETAAGAQQSPPFWRSPPSVTFPLGPHASTPAWKRMARVHKQQEALARRLRGVAPPSPPAGGGGGEPRGFSGAEETHPPQGRPFSLEEARGWRSKPKAEAQASRPGHKESPAHKEPVVGPLVVDGVNTVGGGREERGSTPLTRPPSVNAELQTHPMAQVDQKQGAGSAAAHAMARAAALDEMAKLTKQQRAALTRRGAHGQSR